MVCLGVVSLDGTKLAGNAAQEANKTLPQIERLLAEAAAADAAEDALLRRRAGRADAAGAGRGLIGGSGWPRRGTGWRPRTRLAGTRNGPGNKPGTPPAAEGRSRAARRPADEPRTNRNNTPPRANITDPDCRVMRNQKGYVAGYNGQLVVTAQQLIVGAVLSWHPVDRTLLHPLLDQCWCPIDGGRNPPEAAHRARRFRLRHRKGYAAVPLTGARCWVTNVLAGAVL